MRVKIQITSICYIVYLMSVGLSHGYGQQSSNPFEIIRTDDTLTSPIIKEQKPTTKKSNQTNVFEVYREGSDTAASTIIKQGESSVVSDSLTIIDATVDDFEVRETSSKSQSKEFYTGDNPFDVSHIPYRRSELKEQAASNPNTINKTLKNTTERFINTSVVKKGNSSNTFLFWMILFSLFLLAIVVNVQKGVISRVFKSISNENVLKLSKREENGGLSGHYMMLYVIFFINFACFIYLVSHHFTGLSGMWNWLIIFAGIIILYLMRHTFMSLLGQIFDISKDSSLYNFTIMTFNIFLGLALIPINLVAAFSPDDISTMGMYVGISLIIILLLIRIVRGLLIGARFLGSHIFQFFLYLCSFEIAPILVLIRLIKDFS